MEELVWLSTLLYGPGGLTPNGFLSEFFLAGQDAPVLLLRGYLHTVLTWWVIRGRPALNIKSFMTTTSLEPSITVTPAARTPLTTETTPIPKSLLADLAIGDYTPHRPLDQNPASLCPL
ncbi:hypothetical protein JVU11DRAFT_8694 [Chiua virens]|nr:hypothetical protein JVU11DRAFT_8694 [Chiua virens]